MADTDFPHMPDVPATSDTGGDKGDAISETKALVLDRLARSEDASNYIAERLDLEKEQETGEVETGAARAQRIREALEDARRDTAEAKQANGLDDQLQDAQAQWAYPNFLSWLQHRAARGFPRRQHHRMAISKLYG